MIRIRGKANEVVVVFAETEDAYIGYNLTSVNCVQLYAYSKKYYTEEPPLDGKLKRF